MITGLSIQRKYSRTGGSLKSNRALLRQQCRPDGTQSFQRRKKNDSDDQNGQLTASRLHELAREPSLVNLVNLIILEAIDPVPVTFILNRLKARCGLNIVLMVCCLRNPLLPSECRRRSYPVSRLWVGYE